MKTVSTTPLSCRWRVERARGPATALALGLLVVALPVSPATAQEGFDLGRFGPRPTTDGQFLPSSDTLGHLGVSATLGFGYAYRPLLLAAVEGAERDQEAAVVEHRVDGALVASLGLSDRLQLNLHVPFGLLQAGDDSLGGRASAPGAGFGDIALGFLVRALGDSPSGPRLGPRLGLRGTIPVPSGSQDDLMSDGSVGGALSAVFGFRTKHVEPIIHVGGRIRPARMFFVEAAGPELTYGIGARGFVGAVDMEVALQGATTLAGDRSFQSQTSPLELHAAGRAHLGVVHLGLGFGVGLLDAVGTPTIRGLLTLAVTVPSAGEGPGPEQAAPQAGGDVPAGSGDSRTNVDTDGDGLADDTDFCPSEPESANGFLDNDGCPDGVERGDTHLEMSPPLLFPEQSDELPERVTEALDLLIRLLNDDPTPTFIQIEGHASQDEGDPLGLSERRAEAVRRYLLSHGADAGRLTAVGVGDGQPAAPSQPHRNRRVELRVIDLGP